MAALHSPSTTQNPTQTFLDKKQPLMPRQSTSDVLSFTRIIADRLSPGQNVWDFFSPPEDLPHASTRPKSRTETLPSDGTSLPPISPTSPNSRPSTIMSMITPTSPVSSSFPQINTNNNSRRQSVTLDRAEKSQNSSKSDTVIASSTTSPSVPISAVQPVTLTIPVVTSMTAPTSSTPTSEAATPTSISATETPKLQKRKSFAQSFRNSMITLTQLLSPTSTHSSRAPSPTIITGPPHYNILVLGSDSAPLASTIYKMSSILPGSSKIRHYQEISGFFVAYFRSNDSFSCSPKISTDERSLKDPQYPQEGKYFDSIKAPNEIATAFSVSREGVDEVKSRRSSIQEFEDDGSWAIGRSSEETLLQLKRSTTQSSISESNYGNCSSDNSTINSAKDMEEVLMSDNEEGEASEDKDDRSSCVESDQMSTQSQEIPEPEPESPSVSANASLSIHAFSLDTTWPVPRILAQTFWFPFAHGIIYIVDATRKNDPRGVDHLLNARQFLSTLVADPHFKRKDIPIVVFANKAGLDPETCYRLDEIAEILGCEDWDVNFHLSNGAGGGIDNGNSKAEASRTRPWCVKSTRADGAGDGIRESVEWLKSRMGEIWST